MLISLFVLAARSLFSRFFDVFLLAGLLLPGCHCPEFCEAFKDPLELVCVVLLALTDLKTSAPCFCKSLAFFASLTLSLSSVVFPLVDAAGPPVALLWELPPFPGRGLGSGKRCFFLLSRPPYCFPYSAVWCVQEVSVFRFDWYVSRAI